MAIPEDMDVPWLLLTFTLPSRRASQRVEIWRKLQRYGSVSLGNSGYLLPNGTANEERFQWLAEAIRKYGGEASVVQVKAIDNLSTPQLTRRFSDARTREYQGVIRELHRRGRNVRPGEVTRLKNRFQEIAEVDFFNSPLQRRARELLERADPLHAAKQQKPIIRINARDYKRRMWVTRPRPGVDRCASAWLIRGFIDSEAVFAFAPEERIPKEAVPFDMFCEDGFGHRGNDCTFETLTKAFHVRDTGVAAMGEIVHDADLLDDRFGRKEGFGMDEILKGWARQSVSDGQLLERGMQLAEGLYFAQTKRAKHKKK